MDSPVTLQEEPASYGALVSEEVLQMAREAVKNFHECFWWWDEGAAIKTREEVRAIVRALRTNGGHKAWWAAQRIYKCF